MLYIWPYIVLFSAPLTGGLLLQPLISLLPKGKPREFIQDNLVGPTRAQIPHIIPAALFLALGTAAVHYNTIIHPYTLADNRHYVFYVFRILRRNPLNKYAAVPFYYVCAWITVQSLGSESGSDVTNTKQKREKADATASPVGRQPSQISFFVVWLATTTLSVVSAPLVEPRYFIIPWIIWRLHVPDISATPFRRSASKTSFDLRLVLETVWLLAINAIIAYNFLYRGFSWPNEPGKVQRFLW